MTDFFTKAAALTGDRHSNASIAVWDLPVRVFHWLMVFSFAGAYLTSESDGWQWVHITLGYTLGGLVAFRLVWGVVGTRYARFSNFVRGPAVIAHYVRRFVTRQPAHYVGHNPAGAVAIVVLLLLSSVIVASGWSVYNDLGADWLEDVHETAANAMWLVVAVHLGGVALAGWRQSENLVAAMVSGKKQGVASQRIPRTWRPLGVLLLATVLSFWFFQWQNAPVSIDASINTVTRDNAGEHDDDD